MGAKFDWVKPFLMEMKVAHIISNQAKHGTEFDRRNARWYVHSLTERIMKIDRTLIPRLPKMMNKGSSYKKPFKINGQFMKHPGNYCESVGLKREEVGGPFTAVWYTPFDPSKVDPLKRVMMDYGWMPTEWNQKKMPFNVHEYRRRLNNTSFREFITNAKPDFRDEVLPFVEGFIEKHFKNKPKSYMVAVLFALGFTNPKRAPTFDQIKKQLLLSQFWPTSPKITEDSFDSMSGDDSEMLQLLRERMVLCHRRSLIQGLITQEREDGKLSGECNPCATPTARGRHRVIVNIPAAGAVFGKECRGLFIGDYNGVSPARVVRGKNFSEEAVKAGKARRKGRTNICEIYDKKKDEWEEEGYCYHLIKAGHDAFVGGDGAALELRMLAHYLVFACKLRMKQAKESGNAKAYLHYEKALESAYEYREQILSGDIHSHNQKLAGLPTRKSAKGFIYAFLYGAGNAKLGTLVGGSSDEGEILRETFLRECPCIPVLIDWAQEFAMENGWLPALDGRKLIMRRDPQTGRPMVHKALNTLLQAAGSIVMKYAMCILDRNIKRECLDCHQVIFMHDEYQFTVKWEDVEALRRLIDSCVKTAGEALKMDCPLASDSLLGGSWYSTH